MTQNTQTYASTFIKRLCLIKQNSRLHQKHSERRRGASGGKGGRKGEKETERDWGWGVNKFLLSENSHPCTAPFSVNQTVMPSYWIYSGKEEQRRKRHETQWQLIQKKNPGGRLAGIANFMQQRYWRSSCGPLPPWVVCSRCNSFSVAVPSTSYQ